MDSIFDTSKIQEILPQRYPFLFIDKVLAVEPENKKIVCQKNFTINDYFFKGHFPGNPVVPGVIMIEALAQASILLYACLKPEISEKKPNYYLGKVEARFRRIVSPGDCLVLEIQGIKILETSGIVQAKALVNNEVAVEATITFGVKPK